MKYLKNLLRCSFGVSVLMSTWAQPLYADIVAAQLTHLDVGYSNNMPTKAKSYDGKERDIERFYKDEQLNISISGYVILDSGTRITLGFDNGFSTSKLNKSNTYRVGVDQIIDLTDNSYLTVSGATERGGNVRPTPCTDQYNREYYCGNLTAWSDFRGPKDEQNYNIGLRYTRRF